MTQEINMPKPHMSALVVLIFLILGSNSWASTYDVSSTGDGPALAYQGKAPEQKTYEHLLDLRAKAGDIVLTPLQEHQAQLRTSPDPADYAEAIFRLAILSEARVDRTWWRRTLLTAFEQLPANVRVETGRWYTRKVAARRKLPWSEKDHFIAQVAALAAPLAA